MTIYSVDDFDHNCSIGRLIIQAREKLLGHLNERLASLDLTAAQWGVVVLLAEDPASSPADLCRMLDYDHGAMTRLLKRMEKKGIVMRSRHAGDRRSFSIELTDRAKALFSRILPIVVDVYNRQLDGMTKEEVNKLQSLLQQMLRNG